MIKNFQMVTNRPLEIPLLGPKTATYLVGPYGPPIPKRLSDAPYLKGYGEHRENI